MNINRLYAIAALALLHLSSAASFSITGSFNLANSHSKVTDETERESDYTAFRIQKRTPGNCVNKICPVDSQSYTAAAQGQRTLAPTAQSRISENHVPNDSQPRPRGREREQESRDETPTPDTIMLRQPTPDTLHEITRTSGAASPSLHMSNSIASLTDTLFQDSHARSRSVMDIGRPPLPYSRSDRGRSTTPSSHHSFDAQSRYSDIRNTGFHRPRASVDSALGPTNHQRHQDVAGPSSMHRSSSARGNLSLEEEGRLQRAIQGWQTLMGEHVGHRWSPGTKTEFQELVHDHVEPFRAGSVTADKINALRERHEANVRNLLASEVAMNQIAKSFPNHARRLQRSGLALTMPSNHDRLATIIRHWQERYSGPS